MNNGNNGNNGNDGKYTIIYSKDEKWYHVREYALESEKPVWATVQPISSRPMHVNKLDIVMAVHIKHPDGGTEDYFRVLRQISDCFMELGRNETADHSSRLVCDYKRAVGK